MAAKDRFDLVFGMGGACSCSWALRKAGLQFASYPFDWVARVDLRGRAQIVADDFRNWLVEDQMWFEAGTQSYTSDIYHNRLTGIGFNHDFPKGVPIEESFASVQEKYRRRIDRLFANIRSSRRVLVAWIGVPESAAVPVEHIEFCLKTLRGKFPGVEFRMRVLDCVTGVPERKAKRESGDGFDRISFDYEDHSKKGNRFQVRIDAICRQFRDVEAVDPRTPEQKREFAKVERQKRLRKYAEFGAGTWLGFVVRRRLAKLRRHFEKRRVGAHLPLAGVYDHVLSLGQWCIAAMCMKKAGLRSVSGPFDWMGKDVRIGRYAETLATGFEGMFRPENMRLLEQNHAEGTEHWHDCVQGWKIRHEFKVGVPFEENYANFRAVLDRRIARMLALLGAGGRFLFVHVLGEGHYPREEVVAAVRRMRAAFPSADIDLIVFETEPFSNGVAYEEPEKGVVIAVGDFYDQRRYDPVVGNERLILSVLRRVRMHGRWKNLLRLRLESIRKRIRRHLGKA